MYIYMYIKVAKCKSCHKAIVVITGNANIFMITHVLFPSCFGEI